MKNKMDTKVLRFHKSTSYICRIIIFATILSIMPLFVSGCGSKSVGKKESDLQDSLDKIAAERVESYAERVKDINFYSSQMVLDAYKNGTDIKDIETICRLITKDTLSYNIIADGAYVGWETGTDGSVLLVYYLPEELLKKNGAATDERTKYLFSAYVSHYIALTPDITMEQVIENMKTNKYLEDVETPDYFTVNLVGKVD